jgi:hypothetical protein
MASCEAKGFSKRAFKPVRLKSIGHDGMSDVLYCGSDGNHHGSIILTDKSPVDKPTNMRELHRRTDRNLIIGALVILFVVGGGLIWLLYGAEQALMAELCMGGLLALFGGVFWLILKVLKAIGDSGEDE